MTSLCRHNHTLRISLLFLQEREAAAKMFKGKKGKQFAAEIGKRAKTFVPGAPVGAPAKPAGAAAGAAAGPDASAAQAAAAAEARARQQDMAAIRVSSLVRNAYCCYLGQRGLCVCL